MMFFDVGKIRGKNKRQSEKVYAALDAGPDIALIFYMPMIFLDLFWREALADGNGSDFIKACAALEEEKFEWLNKILVMYYFHTVRLGENYQGAIQSGLSSFLRIHSDDQNDFWASIANKNNGEVLLMLMSLFNEMISTTMRPDYFLYHVQHAYELAPKNVQELAKFI